MSKQRTADYVFRFATIACTIANEQLDRTRHAALSRAAADLLDQAGYIQALAQEEATVAFLRTGEVIDFDVNWRMALNWWNKAVDAFMTGLEGHTQRRIETHMEAFRVES